MQTRESTHNFACRIVTPHIKNKKRENVDIVQALRLPHDFQVWNMGVLTPAFKNRGQLPTFRPKVGS